MSDRIPINLNHAEARRYLLDRHATTYQRFTPGSTVAVKCSCGWRTPALKDDRAADAIARSHHRYAVDQPLEERRRYAIFRETCRHCGGQGWPGEPTDCGWCEGTGKRWVLLDRDGYDRRLVCEDIAQACETLVIWTTEATG